MATPLSAEIRPLLDGPNVAHLAMDEECSERGVLGRAPARHGGSDE